MSGKNKKPVLAITPGDPCGVGPEITIMSLKNHPGIFDICQPLVIGDPAVIERASRIVASDLPIHSVREPEKAEYSPKFITCMPIGDHGQPPEFGKVSASGGAQAYASIEKAIELALQKKLSAVVTAPINKEALRMANVPYLDHTEILTRLTKSSDTMTLFVTGSLRVFFYSRHIEFKDISASLNLDSLVHALDKCLDYLRQIGISKPSVALAALNPHGGEKGMFGREEIEILEPAVNAARNKGLAVEGPVPADSVFHLAKEGHYDAVLSLYHDQGHIATKTLDFHRTVSLTMGLPFLRSSVDHGTAFDIAGKGIASEISMVEAIKSAVQYYW